MYLICTHIVLESLHYFDVYTGLKFKSYYKFSTKSDYILYNYERRYVILPLGKDDKNIACVTNRYKLSASLINGNMFLVTVSGIQFFC